MEIASLKKQIRPLIHWVEINSNLTVRYSANDGKCEPLEATLRPLFPTSADDKLEWGIFQKKTRNVIKLFGVPMDFCS